MDLKDRLGDIETDCRNRLHWISSSKSWEPQTAPTYLALSCLGRSRPQHQQQTCGLSMIRRLSESGALSRGKHPANSRVSVASIELAPMAPRMRVLRTLY